MVLRPLQLLVSIRFQILFHRPPGLLFSFPSLYLFTIGQKEYLVLPHRRGCFLRGFSSPVVLWIRNTYGGRSFRLPDYHRLWFRFPADSTMKSHSHALPLGEERSVRNVICATAQARYPCPRSNLRPTRCVG